MKGRRSFQWFAGLFEGEGSVSAGKGGLTLRAGITMSDLDILQRAQKIIGGRLNGPIKPRGVGQADGSRALLRRNGTPHKPLWALRWSGWRAAMMMERLIPYLGVRRGKQAGSAVERWRARPAAMKA
jgi:hypothetical protein